MYYKLRKCVRRWDKRIILWFLFTFQLLLIGFFVIFRSLNTTNSIIIDDDDSDTYRSSGGVSGQPVHMIRFIENPNASNFRVSTTDGTATPFHLLPAEKFENAFFRCYGDGQSNETTYCFRNGSVDIESMDSDECTCKCHLHYHGKDCGQPEVVWRAFITARLSSKKVIDRYSNVESAIEPAQRQQPFRIFYLIHSTALSLTTVEIQIVELMDLVDVFILCDEIRNRTIEMNTENTLKYRRFRYHQTSSEHRSDFFLKRFKSKILILETRQKCTPKWMYRSFRHKLDAFNSSLANGNDILLFSSHDEILSRQAVMYTKWYNDWTRNQPIKFRLKHNIYGFYWQHPDQTVLRSGACQLHVMDEIYSGDPLKMQNASETGLIFGDLNHSGGWYCQYCYESSVQIVQKLQTDRALNVFGGVKSTNEVSAYKIQQQPSIIDSNYIELLISAGLFVDGKLNLIRLHRFSDQYYAPAYVTDTSWKYESLLTNTYAHYDGYDVN